MKTETRLRAEARPARRGESPPNIIPGARQSWNCLTWNSAEHRGTRYRPRPALRFFTPPLISRQVCLLDLIDLQLVRTTALPPNPEVEPVQLRHQTRSARPLSSSKLCNFPVMIRGLLLHNCNKASAA